MRRSNIFRVLLGIVLVGLSAQVGWVEERNPTNEVDEAARERVVEAYGKLPLFILSRTVVSYFGRGVTDI